MHIKRPSFLPPADVSSERLYPRDSDVLFRDKTLKNSPSPSFFLSHTILQESVSERERWNPERLLFILYINAATW